MRTRTIHALAILVLVTVLAGAVAGPASRAQAVVGPAPRAQADQGYRRAPKAVREVLDAQPLPTVWVSPARDEIILAQTRTYPPIGDLAAPMLRLAGVRVNPRTNAQHRAAYWLALTLKSLPEGVERPIALPPGARVGFPMWTADGKAFAFTNTTDDGVELWVADVATAQARRIEGIRVNPLLGTGIQWMPDQRTLFVRTVPDGRVGPPPEPTVPEGPKVEEGSGKSGIGSTYESRDVLRNAHDEALFDYYCTSSLLLVDPVTGTSTRLGKPDIYAGVTPSPDGAHFLVEIIHRPYSYLHSFWRFPREVEIWDRSGSLEHRLASLPLADEVPIQGEPKGPRYYTWRSNAPATLVWAEALDEGDPGTKVPHRDRLLMSEAPFKSSPTEILRLPERFDGIVWGEAGGLALVDEFDRERRWYRTLAIDADTPSTPPRVIWDLSANDRYGDPGSPVWRILPNGRWVMQQDGGWIYLSGWGATPEGDRPFLDRFNVSTMEKERLFRSDRDHYESFVSWIDVPAGRFLTRRESPRDPPNFYVRTLGAPLRGPIDSLEAARSSSLQRVTRFRDPTPQLRSITKRIVKYERADGVPLSLTLYLPPGYRNGTRLPTILWAYPLEYSDPSTAGQVFGSEQRFTQFLGASPLFFLLQGYAVLDNVAMPVIGHPDSVYNTYLEQLGSNAKAAIDKAAALGVTDRNRVGVAGHSHGAFMTANFLAHSDLFRAGIARSGAFNHTIRPFGFQTERRTYFEAPESYIRLSPALHADQIDEPLLLVHGELDVNPGTVPLQSELLYKAVVGTGGTARLVVLPYESHG
ncbi:MAG: S9 family peptidase, partial [Candidatus Latescibacteria bacterium]|nr:S9 family peptidase [Candidatus Latescibacterota bacterium]